MMDRASTVSDQAIRAAGQFSVPKMGSVTWHWHITDVSDSSVKKLFTRRWSINAMFGALAMSD